MRYFIDTEYNWTPDKGEIIPISIGIVAEDARNFYGVLVWYGSQEEDTPFVRDHVRPNLQVDDRTQAYVYGGIKELRRDILAFVGDDVPEFWGDYAAFDYVVLSMLMGDFEDWPRNWPMHINDLQQLGRESGPSAIPHNALADARAVREAFAGVTV